MIKSNKTETIDFQHQNIDVNISCFFVIRYSLKIK